MKKVLFALLALFSINAYADADWLSPDGMTKVMEGVDDGTFHVSLGHTFPYYGGIFTDAWMSSNGVIILYDPTTQFGNWNTGNSMCCSGMELSNWQSYQGDQFSFMLAPLWTDLVDRNLTPDDGYYYRTDEGGSSFLWYNVNEFYNDNTNTFQVNMWPDGSFDFLYDEVDITEHNTFIGFSGDLTKNEINQLGYYQSGVTEFDIDFHSQSVNGGRAWYGSDGGYETKLDCSNSLNDPQCPGYEEAYYDQQCSGDPLYDSGCQGYEQAYYDQQCSYDDLYDQGCPGYQGALAAQDAAGTDFIFGDDISDFYDTEPEPIIEEPNMFFSSVNETDMFTSYEEETNMFTEPESYEEPIEEPFFEEPIEEVFFDEPMAAAIEEEIYEETVAEEAIVEEVFEEVVEDEYIEEEITQVQEDMSNNDEELLMTQEDMSNNEEELLMTEEPSAGAAPINAVSVALSTVANAESAAIQTAQQQATESAISDSLNTETSVNMTDITSIDVTVTDQAFASVDVTTADQAFASVDVNVIDQPLSQSADALQEFNMSVAVSDATEQESNIQETEMQQDIDQSVFSQLDSAIETATFDMLLDPTIALVEVSVAVESPTEQATQEEQTVDFQMESSTPTTDNGFSAQQDQSFSTGQSITAVLNNVAPNFSQFDVAPPSQQEQQTTQKADAQANNMTDEQLAENLDEFADELQDSGGFTDQSMTVFLMGRNSAFSQYDGQLQDVSFYTDRGMPGGRVQNDRNSMLQLIGTDSKHEDLISLQYK